MSLPYRMFDKEQRVTHAAITENKRLTDVLAFIQTQQEQDPPKGAAHRPIEARFA